MAIKKSVRLSDETQKTCGELSMGGDVNWSGSINSITTRYNFLIEQSLPELSEGEKLAYVAMYNGHMLNNDIKLELRSFSIMVSESILYDSTISELLSQYNVDQSEFVRKSQEYTYPERLAIVDMTQRFWNKGPKSTD